MLVTFADGSTGLYEDEALQRGLEGKIYRSSDGNYAVKLYIDPQKDAERIKRIDTLIKDINPTRDSYWEEYFAWPQKRVVLPRVGFRMRFAKGMKTFDHYIYSRVYKKLQPEERGWFIGRFAAAIKLVSAADLLAKSGLCYPDFSDRNVMVEPWEGRMTLIDCDSLIVPHKLDALVLGANWYLAPEIVMRQVATPSVDTDRHALAVLLYIWFLHCHPLLGDRRLDADMKKNEQLHLGPSALYIEHPNDPSNRDSGQAITSRSLGPEIEKLFQTAFVKGLYNPEVRPYAYEWLEALHRTFDRIIPCPTPYCDWHSFVAMPVSRLTCPRCQQPLRNPATLPFVYLFRHNRRDGYYINDPQAHYIVGWPGRHLQTWHVRSDSTPIYNGSAIPLDTTSQAVFQLDQNKHWYLTNLALHEMYYKNANGWQACPRNSSVPLDSETWIQFGTPPQHFCARVDIVQVG